MTHGQSIGAENIPQGDRRKNIYELTITRLIIPIKCNIYQLFSANIYFLEPMKIDNVCIK